MLLNLSQTSVTLGSPAAKKSLKSFPTPLPSYLLMSNICILCLWINQSKKMSSVMNRLIELTGWIVLVVSVILLGVASHIDNYQPPEPTASVQKK
ncbi:hypothetical protein CKO_01632 [Citrobacter koseri ATCC BAA-895]|uniref:Beta-lactam resistance protein n=2 Tax=Citrobacter koseri TaxID=545 RepID=A8AH01_CITK8|nr:hypothetical protein CKO_01632 [Citrobacter koseri ATCC BAA-895]